MDAFCSDWHPRAWNGWVSFYSARHGGGQGVGRKSDAEMMIRWTQLNALLPAIQFSLAPWDYGEECTELCRGFAKLHTEYGSEILEIAKTATKNGYPIIRPILWLEPKDDFSLICDDEFLLGNDILVAPVVLPNVRKRDIYLPSGTWQDHWTKEIFTGSVLLKYYPAPLSTLPLYNRIG